MSCCRGGGARRGETYTIATCGGGASLPSYSSYSRTCQALLVPRCCAKHEPVTGRLKGPEKGAGATMALALDSYEA